MFDFTQHLTTRLRRHATPQAEPIPGSAQVPNSAGGHAWPVDDWKRFDRFLIFGTERGTYYIRERLLTRENAAAVAACIAQDGVRAVRRVVEISESVRAPKNDPALLVLAMAAAAESDATRAAALAALPAVARNGNTSLPLAPIHEGVPRLGTWRAHGRGALARPPHPAGRAARRCVRRLARRSTHTVSEV